VSEKLVTKKLVISATTLSSWGLHDMHWAVWSRRSA